MAYVVSAHRSSAVTHCLTGSFCAPDARNLLLGRVTSLQLYDLSSSGLVLLHDIPLYGRIAGLHAVRNPATRQDDIFVLTEKLRFCVLRHSHGTILTVAKGDCREAVGTQNEERLLSAVDPAGRCITMQLYQGFVRVIPITATGMYGEAFTTRIEEHDVVDMVMLHGMDAPTLCLLHADSKNNRHVRSYEVVLRERSLEAAPNAINQSTVEHRAHLLHASPGILLCIGEHVISVHRDRAFRSINKQPSIATAVCSLGPGRFLLGDDVGTLSVLECRDPHTLSCVAAGSLVAPSCLAYLDAGVVYVGSTSNDGFLIRMKSQRGPSTTGGASLSSAASNAGPTSFFDELERFPNLSPIVDMCVVGNKDEGVLVTCSGVGRDGSLRIVRSGIGVTAHAQLEIEGLRSVFSVSQGLLVLAFTMESRLLKMEGEVLEEVAFAGFRSEESTLHCASLSANGDEWVQVTQSCVAVLSGSKRGVVANWVPPSGVTIRSAHSNFQQSTGTSTVCVSLSNSQLLVLSYNSASKSLTAGQSVASDTEVSSVSISPDASLLLVGLWSMSIRLYSYPSLTLLTTEKLDSDLIPRNVLVTQFGSGEDVYLLASTGDGALHAYIYSPTTRVLSDKRKLTIGSTPALLVPCADHVFLCCDRPSILHLKNKRQLAVEHVNAKAVSSVSPLVASADELAIVTADGLTLGSMDAIQKLHIKTVPLREQPRKIASSTASNTVLVATDRVTMDESGREQMEAFVRLLEDQAFEPLDVAALEPSEVVGSISAIEFGADGASENADDATAAASSSTSRVGYYVVGTGYMFPDEEVPSKGRILVYAVEQGRLVLQAAVETRGVVNGAHRLPGNKLAVCVNSRIHVYSVTMGGNGAAPTKGPNASTNAMELSVDATTSAHVFITVQRTLGEFILAGDMLKSISLFAYRPHAHSIEDVARDYHATYVTNVEFLDADTYLVSDQFANLLICRRNTENVNEEDRKRLQTTGHFHVGEMVNIFARGSMVGAKNCILFGTRMGSIGVIIPLDKDQLAFFDRLQAAVREVVHGNGGLAHADWRAFEDGRRRLPQQGFVDGDLIERLTEMPREKVQEVFNKMAGPKTTVEDMMKRVEEMEHMH